MMSPRKDDDQKERAIAFLFSFIREQIVTPAYLLLRTTPGDRTTGFIVLWFAWLYTLAFNSSWSLPFLAPLASYVVPVMPLLEDGPGYDLFGFILEDIHSDILLYWLGVQTLLSIITVVKLYTGRGHEQRTRRGESWISLLMNAFITWLGYMPNPKFLDKLATLFLEPLLILGAAFTCYAIADDWVATGYFSSVGLLIFLRAAHDSIMRSTHSLTKSSL